MAKTALALPEEPVRIQSLMGITDLKALTGRAAVLDKPVLVIGDRAFPVVQAQYGERVILTFDVVVDGGYDGPVKITRNGLETGAQAVLPPGPSQVEWSIGIK